MSVHNGHWLRADCARHSVCGSHKISDLDFSDWWVDVSGGDFYLHVASKHDETRHRVHCRDHEHGPPRIGMADGVLYWIPERQSWFREPQP